MSALNYLGEAGLPHKLHGALYDSFIAVPDKVRADADDVRDTAILLRDSRSQNRRAPLKTTDDILACLRFIRSKKQEYFVCLSLDSAHRLIVRRVVTIGLLDTALVHPRELFAGPLKDRAASIIVAHNHPSGDVKPSREDIKTTQQLVAAGQILGIPVRDHIIVAKKEYFSFRSRQLI